MAEKTGATYEKQWTESCTHLISKTDESSKYVIDRFKFETETYYILMSSNVLQTFYINRKTYRKIKATMVQSHGTMDSHFGIRITKYEEVKLDEK